MKEEEKKFDKLEKELKLEFKNLGGYGMLEIRRAIVFGYNKAIEDEHHKHQVSLQCAREGARESLLEDYKGFITEIWNGLEDDLQMDKTGESGYKDEKECIKAIKKYTLKVIKKKAKELNKFAVKNLSAKRKE